MNDDFSPVSELSILKSYALLTQPRHKGRTVSPFGPIRHGYHEYLLSRRPTALILERGRVVPVPKQRPIQHANKHRCPISLTPILSKIAEDYVVHDFVMFTVLKKIDKKQYGTIPKSCTTRALVSMIHNWHVSSHGNAAAIRVVLFDFRKAFDVINQNILVRKLSDYDIPNHTLLMT